jgi:hypothetical protein
MYQVPKREEEAIEVQVRDEGGVIELWIKCKKSH